MTRIIGGVISNNPDSPYTSAFELYAEMSFKLWSIMVTMMHFWSLASFLTWLQPTHHSQPISLPQPLHRWTPCPRLFLLRKTTYWAAGVNHFISLSILPQEKSFLISRGSRHVTASSASAFYHIPWCKAPNLKGFKVRGLEISIPSCPCPESK